MSFLKKPLRLLGRRRRALKCNRARRRLNDLEHITWARQLAQESYYPRFGTKMHEALEAMERGYAS